nr:uncharacterized protein LOC117994968 [Maniola hyperantus]
MDKCRTIVSNHDLKASPFASNQADSAGATEQPSKTEELQYQPSTSMTEELQYQPSTSMAEELQYQPSISTAEELQHQPFKYSMVSGNENAALQLQEVILIKEEITDEEKKQCRLCLSIGRRMKELGEYAHLYRKLLVENNYQNTTIASFMYQMLACWECHAELRRVKRFQDRVRRANNVFETNQNRNCETLSNLSTILIGEYKKSEEEEEESEKLSRVEECAQDIKEEAVEVEVEEISLPDPLEFNQEDRRARWVERNLDIQNEPNKSVLTQKVMRRPKPEPKTAENVPKRVKLGQRVYSGPKRLKLDHSGPKTSKGQENDEIFTKETDPEAIFGKVQIEINELVKILEERRNIESFRNMTFKCDSCILGFTNHNRLLEHNRNFHNQEFGTSECAICERRFTDERRLSAHYRGHFAKFVCKLCNYECYTKTGRAIHFKRHKGVSQGDSVSLSGKDKPCTILLELKTKNVRNEWITASKEKSISVAQVLPNVVKEKADDRVFVREALTKHVKTLLFNAKLKLRNSFQFVWCKDGKGFLNFKVMRTQSCVQFIGHRVQTKLSL